MALTEQDCVDRVREHFSKPGAELARVRAKYNETDTVCVYRKDNDPKSPCRCGIGVLMPDDVYDPLMENICAVGLPEQFPKFAALFANEVSPGFIDNLQICHDSADSVAELLKNLDELAVKRGLN